MAFPLFGLVALAIALAVWGCRRTAALVLACILGLFALSIAVHSVHHLSEPIRAAECPVFSAAQHVSGTLADPCDLYAPGFTITVAFSHHDAGPSFTPDCRPSQPRAPPRPHS